MQRQESNRPPAKSDAAGNSPARQAVTARSAATRQSRACQDCRRNTSALDRSDLANQRVDDSKPARRGKSPPHPLQSQRTRGPEFRGSRGQGYASGDERNTTRKPMSLNGLSGSSPPRKAQRARLRTLRFHEPPRTTLRHVVWRLLRDPRGHRRSDRDIRLVNGCASIRTSCQACHTGRSRWPESSRQTDVSPISRVIIVGPSRVPVVRPRRRPHPANRHERLFPTQARWAEQPANWRWRTSRDSLGVLEAAAHWQALRSASHSTRWPRASSRSDTGRLSGSRKASASPIS
jgi:hypothetical protein